MGGEDTAHGAPPGVGVPTNPRQFEMHPVIVISIGICIFDYNNDQFLQMSKRRQIIFPKYDKVLEHMGENIKLARKRRKLTTIQVAERAGIARSTLYLIEKGDASVAFGAYFNVLRVLGLQEDVLKLAADDQFGRKLQDLDLLK